VTLSQPVSLLGLAYRKPGHNPPGTSDAKGVENRARKRYVALEEARLRL
jgi:hypothetical protein